MAIPAIIGGIASVAGSVLPGLLGGGGGSSSGSGGGSAPTDYYSLFGAQAAAANNPLTAAMQGLSVLQGAFGGALGLEGTTLASSQLSILKEALDRAQKQSATQSAVTAGAAGAGIDLKKQLGQARIATELSGPQLLAQAGSAAIGGENELARSLASTNLGLRQLQETTRAGVAQKQADTLADVFNQRAANEGRLALGAQALESGLKLQQAQDLGQMARIQAQAKAQKFLKDVGYQRALSATKFFA
jgi:hypothetical protein